MKTLDARIEMGLKNPLLYETERVWVEFFEDFDGFGAIDRDNDLYTVADLLKEYCRTMVSLRRRGPVIDYAVYSNGVDWLLLADRALKRAWGMQ